MTFESGELRIGPAHPRLLRLAVSFAALSLGLLIGLAQSEPLLGVIYGAIFGPNVYAGFFMRTHLIVRPATTGLGFELANRRNGHTTPLTRAELVGARPEVDERGEAAVVVTLKGGKSLIVGPWKTDGDARLESEFLALRLEARR